MNEAAGAVFWAILGLALYAYAGYPAVLYLMGAFRTRSALRDDAYTPRVILIISVHNEERIIRDKIENSLALDYPAERLRIVVASDGSVDATNDIVREYESRGVTLKEYDRREGKSATLNKAVLGLDGDVLVFSDANAFYREDAILKLVRNMADEEVGCVVGRLLYLTNHSYVGKGESIRVFPLSNWTELDVWQYIHLEKIPIVPLYFAKERPVVRRNGAWIMVDDERLKLEPGETPQMKCVRFRTLGCYPLSGAVESTATTLPQIIQEMLLTKTSERQGRVIDQDEGGAGREEKKKRGYF